MLDIVPYIQACGTVSIEKNSKNHSFQLCHFILFYTSPFIDNRVKRALKSIHVHFYMYVNIAFFSLSWNLMIV